MEKLVVKVSLNSLSFGNVSYNILKELHKRNMQCAIFPRQYDISAFAPSLDFRSWLDNSINSRYLKLDRKIPSFSLWHINSSEDKLTDKQYLFSFHETSQPTPDEVNILNQQEHTWFSSNWSINNFRDFGANSVSFAPLGFDDEFKVIDTKFDPKVIHWGLIGKFEPNRKNTTLIVQSWCAKYGNNPKHALSLLINNPFIPQDQMNAIYNGIFQGRKPSNVNVLNFIKTNKEMNQFYNSIDIDLSGFSSSEGWGLPAFNATALGKWSIILNATAHKDWATKDNCVLVEPSGLKPAADGMFFRPNEQFNQGFFFSSTQDKLIDAMEKAEPLAKTINFEGLKLQEKFTYSKTVDIILNKIYKNV